VSRIILHLDLDAFFCAVERQRDPELVGKAFAVGGQPDQRGVVASCSYEARAFGVHSAMPMSQAVRLCPDLIIVRHHFDLYRKASREVMSRLGDTTPLVEQISIDEAFMDVTELGEPGESVARRLQAAIHDELDLPCSFGVASNKLVAKIANNLGKSQARKGGGSPNAITVVPPGDEARYLTPLPVDALWGVGPKMAEKLMRLGMRTVGDIARWSEADLQARFGKIGADLSRHARGIDERPVVTEHETKSISKEITYNRDEHNADALKRTLRQLSDGVGKQLRKSGFTCRTVNIKLRWSDFTTLTRQTTMPHAIDQDDEIYAAALALLERHRPPGKAVRLLGVGVSGLDTGGRQLTLWDALDKRQDAGLQSALDALRDRFGEDAVRRGSDLKDED
jgi:DNA polymerase-4